MTWWTWDCQASKEFQFSLIPVRENYYQIRSYYGKCLHVQGNGPQDWTKNAQPVITWSCQDTDEFLFKFIPAGSDYYKIQTSMINVFMSEAIRFSILKRMDSL
ncbi:MAG: RICIN domain-containing protein [Pseudobdellovibrionaceae bacterium]|nr:RICIN domain-containing protein [Pseudobdellovibrionaceae bacterium]